MKPMVIYLTGEKWEIANEKRFYVDQSKNMLEFFDKTIALRYRTAMNRDVSTGLITCPFAHY